MAQISVIVPIYNTAIYLKECLDSLLAQTFHNFEAILVDDGSTDNSFEIANEYVQKDSRFKIFQQENQGVFSARNTGLKHAVGKWITFLDSDDCFSPYFLEKTLKLAEATLSKIAISAHSTFSENLKPTSPKHQKFHSYILNGKEALQNALYQKNMPDYSAWNKLYSAEIWQNTSFKPYKFAEDLATIPEIFLKCNRVAVTTEPLYFYRKRKDSLLSSSYNEDKALLLKIAEDLYKIVSKSEPKLIPAAQNTVLSAAFSILWKTPNTLPYQNTRKQAYSYIKQLRWKAILDTRTRFRNKVASFISIFGKRILIFCMRRFG